MLRSSTCSYILRLSRSSTWIPMRTGLEVSNACFNTEEISSDDRTMNPLAPNASAHLTGSTGPKSVPDGRLYQYFLLRHHVIGAMDQNHVSKIRRAQPTLPVSRHYV